MTRMHHIFLCAAIIVLMITAGCTFMNNSGAKPLVTDTTIPTATPVPPAPVTAGTTPPATPAPGTCAADVSSDAANCGGCGYACPANALCQQGQCFCKEGYAVKNNECEIVPNEDTITGNGCPAGMTPCPDGYCYELASSAGNCGICGNMCPAGMTCSASTCTNVATTETTAPVTTTAVVTTTGTVSGLHTVGPLTKNCFILGLTSCSGSCVNTSTDSSNCGSCGTKCTGPLMGCCKGTCTSYVTDVSNCGSCGHKCLTGSTCESGSCKSKVGVYVTGMVTVAPKISLKITQPIYQQIPGQVVIPGSI